MTGICSTFNDWLSGIILLIEGDIKVDDDLVVDGLVGRVKNIGLRTSELETRDKIVIILPNSKLVSEKVTNWSHTKRAARFQVSIGVSYKSDIDKVESLLLRCGLDHKDVAHEPKPVVHLVEYNTSSIDFLLHFYSKELYGSEQTRSDLRKSIFKVLKENDIEIPFPQMDLWVKKEVLQ